MDVFDLRDRVIDDYSSFVRSFVTIRDERIKKRVDSALDAGRLWPEPLLQLNPAFEPGAPMKELVARGLLQEECRRIFRRKKQPASLEGPELRFHTHQVEGIEAAKAGDNYVLTTGTGSGKSLSYIVPIVDHVLQNGSGRGIQAIVVYPMNALANSQLGELEKFLQHGYPGGAPVTFRRYTGQETKEQRQEILESPPDILLTNYVMLELVLTRHDEKKLVERARDLRFLVLDELHTYRGRQGADVAMLVRRVREACEAKNLIHVGTSATMASGGAWADQQVAVATVASKLFGAEVRPDRVIGETLRRATKSWTEDELREALRERLEPGRTAPTDTTAFLEDPLSSWLEAQVGLYPEPESGRLVRAMPRRLGGDEGLAAALSTETGVPEERCEQAIRDTLLTGYQCLDADERPVFAFRLHQFVSKGEAVYSTLEEEQQRYITLQAQQFAPGSDRTKVLFPVCFCRECGQEYFVVRRQVDDSGVVRFVQRALRDREKDDDDTPGFLFIDSSGYWPDDDADAIARDLYPEDFLEEHRDSLRVKKSRRERRPRTVHIAADGVLDGDGIRAHWFRAPFLFCLRCRVSYSAHTQSDYGKLATLGSEGRSTATTMLVLSTLRRVQAEESLEPEARKLLDFTDNRQDASLQAGHFNDFIQVGLLRAALFEAARDVGASGISHEELTRRVFASLSLPFERFARNPGARFGARDAAERAMRRVLGYYLYRDLRRGWRVTQPNLEQCGLLEIDYPFLDELCAADDVWSAVHPALATASPEERQYVCRVLLDYMRRELAIEVGFLSRVDLESTKQASDQHLTHPWALDEERPETNTVLYPRPAGQRKGSGSVFLSARGGFGRFLKRPTTFPSYSASDGPPLAMADVEQIIQQLLAVLHEPGGMVDVVREARRGDDVPGYQLKASSIFWKSSDGSSGFHDPVRVPSAPDEGLRTNPFFQDLYSHVRDDLKPLWAREHTAQVPSSERQKREDAFREARLPVLFCSPTMELGVDIRQLNVVGLRNVPPTPANYAQRSGRAGRSGQPAFVFTYCSAGSPHDQYYFARPHLMVKGAVATPRLDMANEDLVRAHVHAVWMTVARLDLGRSLSDILDVAGSSPTLRVRDDIMALLRDETHRRRAYRRALDIIDSIESDLDDVDWYTESWLEETLKKLPDAFDRACDRWRDLYRSALEQFKTQSEVIADASRSPEERRRAETLQRQAMAQLKQLRESDDFRQSDFYSYRYFASEGFLPGYNFPRLPLTAWLPSRRRLEDGDDALSRPRFLALTEFGPRSIIYHEGSRFTVNQVMLPPSAEGDRTALLERASRCTACGYLHPLSGSEPGPDLCEYCGARDPEPLTQLFRMQNVSTRRRDRINSDEEERLRLGYDVHTAVRFAERRGAISSRRAELVDGDGNLLVRMTYGGGATLRRINLGWRRRKDLGKRGFLLDLERGYWGNPHKNVDSDDVDPDDQLSPHQAVVVPYVQDSRNCLLLEPAQLLDQGVLASVQSALQRAMQAVLEVEDRELSAEALPSRNDRRLLLFYESAEGGAGVLRRLTQDPDLFPRILREAIDICHFDLDGTDRGHGPANDEPCVAACYECLLAYHNQRDHEDLDRHQAYRVLRAWLDGRVSTSPAPRTRAEHVERLLALCESSLEEDWVRFVDSNGLRLPSHAQRRNEIAGARPDFVYREQGVAIFVDGPHHDAPAQQGKDAEVDARLAEVGVLAVRFHHAADWEAVVKAHPSVFGTFARPASTSAPGGDTTPEEPGEEAEPLDLDLMHEKWHGLVASLLEEDGLTVTEGGDLVLDGRVAGMSALVVRRGDQALHLIDAEARGAAEIGETLAAAGTRSLVARAANDDLKQEVLDALEVK